MEIEIGYIIEYSRKKRLFEPYGERQKAFVKPERLIELMRDSFRYVIWSAHWTNYAEYRVNVGVLPTI